MFSVWNHLIGALMVRIHRFLLRLNKKPDSVLISPNLFFGGFSNLSTLKKIGINSIVDLTESQYNKNDSNKFSINYYSLPIPDRGIPTMNEALTTIKWIQNQLKNNEKVFVHCNLGRGRGPLLTALYLISTGRNKNTVIELLRKKRPYVFFNRKQQEFMDLFEKNYSK